MQQDDEPRTSLELIPEAEITSAIRYLDPDLEIVSAIRYLDADLDPGKGAENAVRMVVGVCGHDAVSRRDVFMPLLLEALK